MPAVEIIDEHNILAEDAKLVTIALDGNMPGTFELADVVDAIGDVVNKDQIEINEDGDTSGEIQFYGILRRVRN